MGQKSLKKCVHRSCTFSRFAMFLSCFTHFSTILYPVLQLFFLRLELKIFVYMFSIHTLRNYFYAGTSFADLHYIACLMYIKDELIGKRIKTIYILRFYHQFTIVLFNYFFSTHMFTKLLDLITSHEAIRLMKMNMSRSC